MSKIKNYLKRCTALVRVPAGEDEKSGFQDLEIQAFFHKFVTESETNQFDGVEYFSMAIVEDVVTGKVFVTSATAIQFHTDKIQGQEICSQESEEMRKGEKFVFVVCGECGQDIFKKNTSIKLSDLWE